jgi:hypothetical protein
MQPLRHTLIYAIAALTGALLGIALWLLLAPGPQQVGWVLRAVYAVTGPLGSVHETERATLTRQGWSGHYLLDITGLDIHDKGRVWKLSSPRIRMEFSLPDMLYGRPVVSVRSPHIKMEVISHVGVAKPGDRPASESWELAELVTDFFAHTHVPELYIERLDMSYRQPEQSIHWETSSASVTTAPDAQGKMIGKLEATLAYNLPVLEVTNPASADAGAAPVTPVSSALLRAPEVYGPFLPSMDDEPLITRGISTITLDIHWPGVGAGGPHQPGNAAMVVKGFPLAIGALLDARLAPLAGLRGTVDANLRARLSPSGHMTEATLDLVSARGAYVQYEWYNKPIRYKDFRASIVMGGKPGVWLLKEASVATPHTTGRARGMLDISGRDPVFDIITEVQDFPASALDQYWPKTAGPDARDWVLEHITAGNVTKAIGRFRLTKADYAAGRTFGQALFAQLDIEDMNVGYYEDMKPVTAARGFVQFTGRGLKARLLEGRIGQAKASDMALDMDDFLKPVTHLHLRANIEGSASELADYLSHPVLQVSQLVGLDAARATGRVSGEYSMHLAIPEAGEVMMDYGVEATLHDVATPSLLGKYDVSGANGRITIVRDTLRLDGMARLADVPAKVELDYAIGSPEEAVDYTVFLEADGAGLARLGFSGLDGGMGKLGGTSRIRADVNRRKGREITKLHVDLKDATFDVPLLGYSKPKGKAATTSLTATYDDTTKITAIDDLTMSGEGLNVQGNIVVDGSSKTGWREVKLPVLKMGKSDLTVDLSRKQGGIHAQISGNVLDASSLLDKGDELTADGGGQSTPLEVNANVVRMVFGDKRELSNVSFTMSCGTETCHSARAKGALPGGEAVTYALETTEGARRVRIHTSNAGEFFRVLDISDNVVGGVLELKGRFDDSKTGRPLLGVLKVDKFKTLRANALAKLLNVASLTGITELLEGGGIGFEKLHAPFVYGNDVIEVKDAYSIGPSLGITFTGKVDTKQDLIDADGAVIPSYMVNGMVGNIPIIGQLLTGGDSKGGLFAVNYSMKGSLKDPDVIVNPLSILTPGFLRKIFDIPAAVADSASNAPKIGDAIEKEDAAAPAAGRVIGKPPVAKPMGTPNKK